MTFENRRFYDGENSYQTPEWKRNLNNVEDHVVPTPFEDNTKKKTFRENEIGFSHPDNGSYFRMKDDGTIELFTAYGTGIRLRADNIVQIFGDKVQHITREPSFKTSPNYQINNSEYATYPKQKGLSLDFIERLSEVGIDTYGMEEHK